jgi:transposase-like protein
MSCEARIGFLGEECRGRLEYCLMHLEYPDLISTMLKTNGLVEQNLQELRRRIMPMRLFNSARNAERVSYDLIARV